jgi:hypothetical protein
MRGGWDILLLPQAKLLTLCQRRVIGGLQALRKFYFLSGGLEALRRFQTTREMFFGGGEVAPNSTKMTLRTAPTERARWERWR